jgi:hypothetical protein
MRTVTPELAALINGGDFDTFDLYTFDVRGGGSLYLTTAPFDVAYGDEVWPRNGPIVLDDSSQRAHWKVGLDVDSWTLTLAPRTFDHLTGETYPDKIGTEPMLSALRAGVISGSQVTVQRAYFDPSVITPGSMYAVAGVIATGLIVLFKGLTADLALDVSTATLTLNDYRSLLSSQMPRNIYQAPCRHMLYDSGCKLNAGVFERVGTVSEVWSQREFFANPGNPSGSQTYTLGRVRANDGPNEGLLRTIRGWDGATHFVTVSPFPYPISVGNSMSFWPGCLKTLEHCALFNNLDNYGGDPYIPPPAAAA